LVDATRQQLAATIRTVQARLQHCAQEQERVAALIEIATPALSKVKKKTKKNVSVETMKMTRACYFIFIYFLTGFFAYFL
tara:strand:+ start:111 stop:350 length:240 start_codon:yes stop_codon:yes gene_type:complete